MALTKTAKSLKEAMYGGRVKTGVVNIGFDSSYAFGGESLDFGTIGNLVGFAEIYNVLAEPQGGYTFEYDYTNEKLKAFAPTPPIVYEEVQTIASNAITLDYPAAAILQIATATQSQMLIEPADTLAANECQLDAAMSAGARPTINFHSGTSGAVTVTYITQAWKEVWDNREASVDFATATHVADLDDTICFIESMTTYDTGGSVVTSLSGFVRGGDAAAATECEVDWSDSAAAVAGDTTLTFNAGDAVTDIKLTYIKLPTSGFLFNRFIEDEDLTIASNVGASAYPILFQAVCNQLADYHAANEEPPHYLMMPEADALGTSRECRIDWHLNKTLAGTQVAIENSTSDALSLTYIYGWLNEIPGMVPIEVPNATDLSALTNVRVTVTGRVKV